MAPRSTPRKVAPEPASHPLRLGLPGFISEETGLGDLVSQTAHRLGIPTCGGCRRRAEAMNRWLVVTPGRR